MISTIPPAITKLKPRTNLVTLKTINKEFIIYFNNKSTKLVFSDKVMAQNILTQLQDLITFTHNSVTNSINQLDIYELIGLVNDKITAHPNAYELHDTENKGTFLLTLYENPFTEVNEIPQINPQTMLATYNNINNTVVEMLLFDIFRTLVITEENPKNKDLIKTFLGDFETAIDYCLDNEDFELIKFIKQ